MTALVHVVADDYAAASNTLRSRAGGYVFTKTEGALPTKAASVFPARPIGSPLRSMLQMPGGGVGSGVVMLAPANALLTPPIPAPGQVRTFEHLIYIESASGSYITPVMVFDGVDLPSSLNTFEVFIDNTNIDLSIGIGGSFYTPASTPHGLSPGWHYITSVFDLTTPASPTLKVYVDGSATMVQPPTAVNLTGWTLSSGMTKFAAFGVEPGDSANPGLSLIETCWHDRALTLAEIKYRTFHFRTFAGLI